MKTEVESKDNETMDEFIKEMKVVKESMPSRLSVDPAKVEQGLAKLVLTLIELIRKLLEKQAIRRIEAGNLSDEEIDRMGDTFMRLEEKMEELKEVFGLEDEELNLDLGPLGDLM